jgi:hypothetical protein
MLRVDGRGRGAGVKMQLVLDVLVFGGAALVLIGLAVLGVEKLTRFRTGIPGAGFFHLGLCFVCLGVGIYLTRDVWRGWL